MKDSGPLFSPGVRMTLSALAAFVVYGCWAFFANMSHGTGMGIQAALTQGGYSFILTLSMSYVTEWIYQFSQRQRYRFQLTFLSVCLLLYSSSWSINALLGTPEILLTILPGAIIGTFYTYGYTLVLSKIPASSQS